jgi:hypothetical protein
MVTRHVLFILREVNELEMHENAVLRKLVGKKGDKHSNVVGGGGVT